MDELDVDMAGFQAIDLDAVLDEFEQNVQDDDQTAVTKEKKLPSPPPEVEPQPQPNGTADEASAVHDDEFYDAENGAEAPQDPPEDLNGSAEPIEVSSGLDDSSNLENGAEHIEAQPERSPEPESPPEAAQVTDQAVGGEPESEPDSSPVYESIYDKYRSKDSSTTSSSEDDNTPVKKPVKFEPADVPEEEVSRLLDELDVEEGAAASVPVSEQGARPKERPQPSTSIPADSPPPYSEVDPMKPTLQRPTSLELTNEEEEPAEEPEPPADDLEPVVGPPGSTPANPNGPNEAGVPELLQGLSEDQLMLGKISPFWIPDGDAANCMICDSRFTMVKRRHHCRACGKVLCGLCCSDKHALQIMDGKEGQSL